MPIRRDLEAELESLGQSPSGGVWSLVVWVDRAVRIYTSRELGPIGDVFLRSWDFVRESPTPCSMGVYLSDNGRVPEATDFTALFRCFSACDALPFILGEDELRATMKAETAALSELKNIRPVTAPQSLEIELF